MKKISLLILGILFILIGFLMLHPKDETIEKFSLDEKYYHEGVFLKKSAEEINSLENGNYTVHTTFNGTMFLTKAKSVSDLAIDDGMETTY